jgi:hypothetical protein
MSKRNKKKAKKAKAKQPRSLSQVSIEDANKKKRMVDFAAVAWLKRIGSKMLLSVIGMFIYRSDEVDKWPITRALRAQSDDTSTRSAPEKIMCLKTPSVSLVTV